MPKAVPYLTVFGTRPQKLRTPAGAKPYAPPKSQRQSLVVADRPGAPTTRKLPLGEAPAGRPPSNLGNYLLKPTNDTMTGFEMLNDNPDLLNQVHDKYLSAYQLPPALQPKYLRKPAVMEQGVGGRATKISRGWRAPRSRAR